MASEQAKTHTTKLFKKMPVFISSSEAIKYCFLFMFLRGVRRFRFSHGIFLRLNDYDLLFS